MATEIASEYIYIYIYIYIYASSVNGVIGRLMKTHFVTV